MIFHDNAHFVGAGPSGSDDDTHLKDMAALLMKLKPRLSSCLYPSWLRLFSPESISADASGERRDSSRKPIAMAAVGPAQKCKAT